MASSIRIDGIKAQPHPHAIFALVPYGGHNPGATSIIELNHQFVSRVPLVSDLDDGNHHQVWAYGINVGFQIGNRSRHVLATLGRNGNIITPVLPPAMPGARKWASMSSIQCSFEVHPTTKAVLLYDRSSHRTTGLVGPNAQPFADHQIPRRVLMDENINDVIALPGQVKFQVVWHRPQVGLGELMSLREDPPRLAQTVREDDVPTAAATVPATPIHTLTVPPKREPKIRYKLMKRLGGGSFGQVHQVVLVDSGELLAVKKIVCPGINTSQYTYLTREVETMARLSHVSEQFLQIADMNWAPGGSGSFVVTLTMKEAWLHGHARGDGEDARVILHRKPNIIEFKGVNWPDCLGLPNTRSPTTVDDRYVEIFMLEKEGNIRELFPTNPLLDTFVSQWGTGEDLARRLVHEGLKGLDYLASKELLHRDIKPENILWTTADRGTVVFQLADFGLCNTLPLAKTVAGSPLYKAPEITEEGTGRV
ncbi:MAG: hypothetical protein M1823_001807 [Watsoniomyces obsoletus]|nr:MAG: hypothetical protein M1823_001807 [Watsoniomyces obsoletus]